MQMKIPILPILLGVAAILAVISGSIEIVTLEAGKDTKTGQPQAFFFRINTGHLGEDLLKKLLSDINPFDKRSNTELADRGFLDDPVGTVTDTVNDGVDTVKDGVNDGVDAVKDGVNKAVNWLNEQLNNAIKAMRDALGIKDFYSINTLTICRGTNKDDKPDAVDKCTEPYKMKLIGDMFDQPLDALGGIPILKDIADKIKEKLTDLDGKVSALGSVLGVYFVIRATLCFATFAVCAGGAAACFVFRAPEKTKWRRLVLFVAHGLTVVTFFVLLGGCYAVVKGEQKANEDLTQLGKDLTFSFEVSAAFKSRIWAPFALMLVALLLTIVALLFEFVLGKKFGGKGKDKNGEMDGDMTDGGEKEDPNLNGFSMEAAGGSSRRGMQEDDSASPRARY